MKDDIGAQVKKAAIWTYASSFFTNILQFIIGILLARILGPADFGVFIAATAFTTVLSVMVNFGLPQALVQGNDVTEKHFNSAYWTMSLVAVLCAGALWLGLQWIQIFYHDDRFSTIAMLMGITLFLIPFVAVNSAILRRRMDFKTINLVAIKTTIYLLPLPLGLALTGFGPFSLVAVGITGMLTTIFMFWRKTHWLPRRPEVKTVRMLLPYAFKTNLNNLQNVLSERVDNMLVGALVGTAPLGIYNRAYSLARMPVEQLAENLQPVLFSGLAQIQDDIWRTRKIYHKSLCALALAVFPILALFWLVAPDFIGLLYGAAWMPAVEPLRIMSIGAAAMLLTLSFRSLSAAQNLVGREVWVHFTGLIVLIVFVVVGSRWGVSGVSIGVSLKEILVLLIFQRVIARSHLEFGWWFLFRALAPAAIGTFICAFLVAISYSYFPDSHWVRLLGVSLVFLTGYILVLKIIARIWVGHEELHSTLQIAEEIISRIPGMPRLGRAV